MDVMIRTISSAEWPLWRDLRMRALADSPDAFRATLEEESNQPNQWWAEILGGTADHPRGGLWVAWVDGEPSGMLFSRVNEDCTMMSIGAMWVAPDARRGDVGSGLIQACLEWGRGLGASTASLWVTAENAGAVAFYERHGFEPTAATEALRPGSNLTVRKFETSI